MNKIPTSRESEAKDWSPSSWRNFLALQQPEWPNPEAHSEALDEFGGRRPALAIHGTDEVEYIGTEISNGCIRMKPEDIDFFAQYVTLGTRVSIIP